MDRPGVPTHNPRVAFAEADTQPFTVVKRRQSLSHQRSVAIRIAIGCGIAISLSAAIILVWTLTSTSTRTTEGDHFARAVGIADTEAETPIASASPFRSAAPVSAISEPLMTPTTNLGTTSPVAKSATQQIAFSPVATREPSPTGTTAPSATPTAVPTSTATATATSTATEQPTSRPRPTEQATKSSSEKSFPTAQTTPTSQASVGKAAVELIKNGSFEDGDANWFLEAGARSAGINAANGQRALILPAANGYADQLVKVVPGTTYQFSAKGLLGASTDSGEVSLQFIDADGNVLTEYGQQKLTFTKTIYQEMSTTFVVPADVAGARVFVSKQAGAGIFAVDGISLQAIDVST